MLLVCQKNLQLVEFVGQNDLQLIIPGIKDLPIHEPQPLPVKNTMYCRLCKKYFATPVSYRDHYQSNDHLINLKNKIHKEEQEEDKDFKEYMAYEKLFPFLFFTLKGKVHACMKNAIGLKEHIYRLFINKEFHLAKECFGMFKERLSDDKPLLWTFICCRGGYFAAGIVDVRKRAFILHKTFHRYTVRRKQGGSQSSRDNSGSKPKSAGATLRRYNETKLSEEVDDLMLQWKEELDNSDLVFMDTPSFNAKLFVDYFKNDQRLMRIPFTTKRPSFEELKRCFQVLTQVWVLEENVSNNEIEIESIDENQEEPLDEDDYDDEQ